MKLALRAGTSGVSVLAVEGVVSPHEIQVLRAGVTRLLGSGKNKILIEFNQVDTLDSELIRELAVLNLKARELSGEIAVSTTSVPLKARLDSFFRPAVLYAFSTESEAIVALQLPPEKRVAAVAPAPAAPAAALAAPADAEGGGELERLRAENAELKALKDEWETRLNAMAFERRWPADEAGLRDKIRALEGEVARMAPPPSA